jgi:hypothetical protein
VNRKSRAALIIKTALFVITAFVVALPAVATNASRSDLLQISRLAEMFERPATYKLKIRRGEQSLQIPLTTRKLI